MRKLKLIVLSGILSCALLAGCQSQGKSAADNSAEEKTAENKTTEDKSTEDKQAEAASGVSEAPVSEDSGDSRPVMFYYQNHPCVLTDPVSGAELITGNYYTVTLDDNSREKYPKLAEVLEDFNSSEEDGIEEEMFYYQTDAIDLKINGVQYGFQNDRDFYPKRADDLAFSFAELNFSYLGGAHGTVGYYSQNFDPKTGDTISLDDVVKNTDNLPVIIVSELEDQNKDIKKYFEDCPTDRTNLLDNIPKRLANNAEGLVWTLDYDGISVYFEDYAMGSYAAGTQIVNIAFADYPDLFTDTYACYDQGKTPDIAVQAKKDKDAEQKTIKANESMWDYNEADDEADMAFYGLWVGSSAEKQESVDLVYDLRNLGLDAYCIYTPEWENLNSASYWSVTVGRSETEADAKALIEKVEKAGYKGSYVKYTGERLSHRVYYYMYTPGGADITPTKVTLNDVPTEELSGTDEDEGPMTLIVDSDTVFDKTCDMQSFPGYKKGDSPLEWFNSASGTDINGVFEVGIDGNHIDSFYGSYWWD